MNDIENAIEYIETNYRNIGIDYSNGKDHTAITLVDKQAELAIEALREKLEREKGCSFCNDKRVVSFCATSYHSSLEPITIIEDLYFGFCPHCGRKLGENNG